ncbi:hypothetical protein VO178_17115 [Lysinibacillus fusiformis]|nr:hypothetical protein [Lysinibacillus fusiformis]WRT00329.1 hypothetical protein VO178_17115 [Lysinibacillus fusiformis]
MVAIMLISSLAFGLSMLV